MKIFKTAEIKIGYNCSVEIKTNTTYFAYDDNENKILEMSKGEYTGYNIYSVFTGAYLAHIECDNDLTAICEALIGNEERRKEIKERIGFYVEQITKHNAKWLDKYKDHINSYQNMTINQLIYLLEKMQNLYYLFDPEIPF